MKIKKLCIAIVALMLLAIPVRAAGNIDLTQSGSIQILMKHNGEPVPGGKLVVYQIADLIWDEDAYALVFTDTFEDCDLSLGDISSDAAALTFAEYVEKHQLPGIEKIVGENGKAVFDELPLGLFLVTQNDPATGYSSIKPFLIKLPENGNNGVNYDVDATPKVSVEFEPDEPEEPEDPDIPQTGQLQWPVPVLAAAGLLVFSMGWFLCFVKRKDEK